MALLPYLDALGVGALYASPLLESGAGSNHGYDVVDPTRVSAERGGERARGAGRRAARARAAASCSTSCPTTSASRCRGPTRGGGTCSRTAATSRYAGYFDIDWDAGPMLLPVLDADEATALSELTLSPDRDELRYYEHAFPVAPGTGEAGTARRRCTSASTTGSCPGGAARPS